MPWLSASPHVTSHETTNGELNSMRFTFHIPSGCLCNTLKSSCSSICGLKQRDGRRPGHYHSVCVQSGWAAAHAIRHMVRGTGFAYKNSTRCLFSRKGAFFFDLTLQPHT